MNLRTRMKTRFAVFVGALLALVGASSLIASADAETIVTRLSGSILLQVEQNGEAWYVYPGNQQRYYLGRPSDAFDIMRSFGLGVRHDELVGYQQRGWPSRLAGMIMLDVEANGEAYYVDPDSLEDYYLGRPADAFAVMRQQGLGITDKDLAQITIGAGSALPGGGTAGAAATIVDTGQRYCFGDSLTIGCPAAGAVLFGQDAQYQGAAPSYTDNGDGTVTDNNTGLMWQKDPGSKTSYAVAQAGAESFSLAGYSDWRLPSIKELYSLILFSGRDISPELTDASGVPPFIDDDAFVFSYGDVSAGERIIDSQWTTSSVYGSTVMNGQRCFFGVNFADGRIKCYPADKADKGYFTIHVRGAAYGQNDFQDNGDQTVTDRSTGLVWTKNDNGSGVLWKDALAYCEGLTLAGRSDWRLPNAKELQYIVDYSRSPDITGSAAIDPVFSVSQITNERNEADYPYYWTGTTHASDPNCGSEGAYLSFGRALGNMTEFGGWVDVHGAGAQRSDPKDGVSAEQANGFGPQGDARRAYNYVRCVRGGDVSLTADTAAAATGTDSCPSQSETSGQASGQSGLPGGQPPQAAYSACFGQLSAAACSFAGGMGETVTGTCVSDGSSLFCRP